MVGTGEMALVKMFDMRMPGSHNYMDAGFPGTQSYFHCHPKTRKYTALPLHLQSNPARAGISLYLSERHPSTLRRGQQGRYKGPIYAICPPSAASSSFYVGVEGGVIRLDVTDTDDLKGSQADWYIINSNLVAEIEDDNREPPLELKGYRNPETRYGNPHPQLYSQQWNMRALRRGERRDMDAWSKTMPGWDRPWTVQPRDTSLARRRGRGPWGA
jgi:hypothetical protein